MSINLVFPYQYHHTKGCCDYLIFLEMAGYSTAIVLFNAITTMHKLSFFNC